MKGNTATVTPDGMQQVHHLQQHHATPHDDIIKDSNSSSTGVRLASPINDHPQARALCGEPVEPSAGAILYTNSNNKCKQQNCNTEWTSSQQPVRKKPRMCLEDGETTVGCRHGSNFGVNLMGAPPAYASAYATPTVSEGLIPPHNMTTSQFHNMTTRAAAAPQDPYCHHQTDQIKEIMFTTSTDRFIQVNNNSNSIGVVPPNTSYGPYEDDEVVLPPLGEAVGGPPPRGADSETTADTRSLHQQPLYVTGRLSPGEAACKRGSNSMPSGVINGATPKSTAEDDSPSSPEDGASSNSGAFLERVRLGTAYGGQEACPSSYAEGNVLLLRNLHPDVTETDIRELLRPFCRSNKHPPNVFLNKSAGRAYVEFDRPGDALETHSYFNMHCVELKGRHVEFGYPTQFESSEEEDEEIIVNSGKESHHHMMMPADRHHREQQQHVSTPSNNTNNYTTASSSSSSCPSKVLLVSVSNLLYPVDIDLLKYLFGKFGSLQKIICFSKSPSVTQALIQFSSPTEAGRAQTALHNRNIYDGCNLIQIQPSKLEDLTVRSTGSKAWCADTEDQRGGGGASSPGGGGGAHHNNRHHHHSSSGGRSGNRGARSRVRSEGVNNNNSSRNNKSGGGPGGNSSSSSSSQTSMHHQQQQSGCYSSGGSSFRHHLPEDDNNSSSSYGMRSSSSVLSSSRDRGHHGGGNGSSPSSRGDNNKSSSNSIMNSSSSTSNNNNNASSSGCCPIQPLSLESILGPSAMNRLPKEVKEVRLSQLNPNSTPVLIIYNITPKSVTVTEIFNVFSLFGCVSRIKILRDKPHTALVQYSDPLYATMAAYFLQGVPLFDAEPGLQVCFSRNTEVKLPNVNSTQSTSPESQEDLKRTRTFHSKDQRFKASDVEKYLRAACKPTNTLFIANVAERTTETELREILTEFGTIDAMYLAPRGHKQYAMVQVTTPDQALHMLARLHNYKLHDVQIKIAFTRLNIQSVTSSSSSSSSSASGGENSGSAAAGQSSILPAVDDVDLI